MVALHQLIVALALTTSDPVLLDFSADWCGPCRQMEPVIQQLTAAGYPVRKVNIDAEKALASQHQVTGIPCFVLVANGREVDRVVGAVDGAQLVAMFEKAGIRRGTDGAANRQPTANVAAPTDAIFPPSTLASTPLPVIPSAAPFSSQMAAGNTAGSPAATPEMVRQQAIAASVRLKIQDPDGNSVGSGTIIDAREGEALVLTCGHVFRDSQGKGRIIVDLFGPNAAQGIPARLIKYDLKSDVGLVSFRATTPITAARVAPTGHKFAPGDTVINVGCSHGAEPTAREGQVTALDRFLGPPNVEVTGQPVQGRSGGGLFTADGLVIGVCNAADPSSNEGLYAALGAIHAALDESRLSVIYQSPVSQAAPKSALAAIAPPPMPERMPAFDNSPAAAPVPRVPAGLAGDSEVICIVRPHSNPAAKSEIIVINRATPALLDLLASEQRSQSGRQMTSLQVPSSASEHASVAGGTHPATAGSPLTKPASTVLRWLQPRSRASSAVR